MAGGSFSPLCYFRLYQPFSSLHFFFSPSSILSLPLLTSSPLLSRLPSLSPLLPFPLFEFIFMSQLSECSDHSQAYSTGFYSFCLGIAPMVTQNIVLTETTSRATDGIRERAGTILPQGGTETLAEIHKIYHNNTLNQGRK